MKARLIIIALLAFSSSALALIGEDPKQIDARYGDTMEVLADRGDYREVCYAYRGFMLMVRFMGGIAKQEGFANPDKSALSPEAVKNILAISAAPGTTWLELPPRKSGDHWWRRSDLKAIAILPAEGNFFIVQAPDFVEPE